MEQQVSPADAALNIMRQWWWPSNPERPFAGKMDLSEALNRLAMDGAASPKSAILALLSRGDLLAEGSFRWRKYQGGEFYYLEEGAALIRANRWQTLQKLIADEWLFLSNDEWPDSQITLEKLEIRETEPYDWQPGQNQFSTALCPPDKSAWDSGYYEEWFSAWDISIWPLFVREDHPEPETEPTEPAITKAKGGRPPAADWELAALEIAGHYYRGDFKPKNIADVGRELASWLGNQDLHPSDSVIRIHAKRIFEAFEAWEHE
ncbi:hypothetical protein [Novosphingobium cyanobacteriorum]|uniref:Uncharacterized protein n=1 Tax=Novosphingobium cyanobacteriorum TaxID=3024215 RepID=A0ABT6CDL7_9SPHN|nr:hypothetical protein [Novosphingobium cyanobacteriorum]MDF8332015.1 hypothetical protein [Novosphingobium cyanobacteriorum]